MVTQDFLGESRFVASVVPARVGYLIKPRSRPGMRRSIEEACTRWGGATEPIVAVGSAGRTTAWDRQVVELLSLDGLVNVDAAPDAAQRFAAKVGLPLTALKFIDSHAPSRFTTFPTSVTAEEQPSQLMLPSDSTLWQATAVGCLNAAGQESMGRSGVPLSTPFSDDVAGRQQLLRKTLLDLTVEQLSEHWATGGLWPTPAVIWVTAVDDIDDCRWFWNLRALRSLLFEPHPMILVPDIGVEHWVDFDRALGGVLGRAVDIEPDVLLGSLNVPRARLDQIAALFGLVVSVSEPRASRRFPQPAPRVPPFTYRADLELRQWFVYERRYGLQTPKRVSVFRSGTHVEFESPVGFRHPGFAQVRIASASFDALPKRRSVANLVLANAEWRSGQLQVCTSAERRYQFELRIPPTDEVLVTMLHERGVRHVVSDKGASASAIASRLAAYRLLDREAYQVLNALTTPRSKSLAKWAAKAVSDDRLRSELLDLVGAYSGQSARRHRSAEQLRSTVRFSFSTLETLVAERWIERGFVTNRCPACGLSHFVPLAETTPGAECPACARPAGYHLGIDGPDYSYRLDPIVDRASDQGVLPQLMCTELLHLRDAQAYLIPGADLQHSDGRNSEADVLGIFEQKLVVGEVKTFRSKFTEDELLKDAVRAADVGADILVLGCAEQLDRTFRRAAGRIARQHGLELAVLAPLERPKA